MTIAGVDLSRLTDVIPLKMVRRMNVKEMMSLRNDKSERRKRDDDDDDEVGGGGRNLL